EPNLLDRAIASSRARFELELPSRGTKILRYILIILSKSVGGSLRLTAEHYQDKRQGILSLIVCLDRRKLLRRETVLKSVSDQLCLTTSLLILIVTSLANFR